MHMQLTLLLATQCASMCSVQQLVESKPTEVGSQSRSVQHRGFVAESMQLRHCESDPP